jgi:lipopolysaccharide export system ATP-binding protein
VKKRKAVKKVVKKVPVVDSTAPKTQEAAFLATDSAGLQTNTDATANLQAEFITTVTLEKEIGEPINLPVQDNFSTGKPANSSETAVLQIINEPVVPIISEPVAVPANPLAAVSASKSNGKSPAPENISVLGADSLRKSYRKRTVVHNISLEIKQNEIVGLLGPNGAGKTTVFYMIVGLEKPDKGKIYLDTKDISRLPMYLRARNGISYLPQEASVFRKLTVEENILLVLQTLPLSKREREHRLESLLDELDIEYVRHTKAYQLSGGERRRTEIARCLVIEPRFILLDEPFAGIDPIAVIDIQRILQKLRERGIGVLITDHNVRETLAITDRAYIINEGQIFRAGTPDALTKDEEVKRVYLGENFRM